MSAEENEGLSTGWKVFWTIVCLVVGAFEFAGIYIIRYTTPPHTIFGSYRLAQLVIHGLVGVVGCIGVVAAIVGLLLLAKFLIGEPDDDQS